MDLSGTVITAAIVPGSDQDIYATHKEEYGAGGYRTVATTSDRNSIPLDRRVVGMLVNVSANSTIYKLDSDSGNSTTTDSNWSVLETGGTATIPAPPYWCSNGDAAVATNNAVYAVAFYQDIDMNVIGTPISTWTYNGAGIIAPGSVIATAFYQDEDGNISAGDEFYWVNEYGEYIKFNGTATAIAFYESDAVGGSGSTGPQGPQGPQGVQGATGTPFFEQISTGNIVYEGNVLAAGFYQYTGTDPDGHDYSILGTQGPQGAQGPQGPQGTPYWEENGSDGIICNNNVTANAFFESSDDRLKTYYGELITTLDDILKIPLVRYTLNNDCQQREQLGTSAQSLEPLYPELVMTNDSGIKSVQYDRLAIIALKGIELLYNELQELKK